MFDQFSERSRRVMLFTRLAAGKRGAAALGCEHLLEGILQEDNPKRLPPPFNDANMSFKSYRSFFADDVASELLSDLESESTRGIPIPDAQDMSLSTDLGITLAEAGKLADKSQRKLVEPLHLLAAVVMSKTPYSELLRRRGVTSELVFAALESGDFF